MEIYFIIQLVGGMILHIDKVIRETGKAVREIIINVSKIPFPAERVIEWL